MTLGTTYLGMQMRNPVIVGSSKLTAKPEDIRKCSEAGAGAVVLRSLFEEQIISELEASSYADSSYKWEPRIKEFVKKISKDNGIYDYLRLIEIAKAQNPIPIIASINCISLSNWSAFAKRIEDAGADALELNISYLPADEKISADEIEKIYCDIVKQVVRFVHIPVAVKIGANFTNIVRFCSQLSKSGAQGVVVFNRYFQPDMDIDKFTVTSTNFISALQESLYTLRYVSLLSKKIKSEISASTGIHDGKSVIKQLLVGAQSVQICSALYKYGIPFIETILQDIRLWMKRHKYESVEEFRGIILKQQENIDSFDRLQYIVRDFEERKIS